MLFTCKLYVDSMETSSISNTSFLQQLCVSSVQFIIDFWYLLIGCYNKIALNELLFYKYTMG